MKRYLGGRHRAGAQVPGSQHTLKSDWVFEDLTKFVLAS
jgi:hypothetical protein